MIIDELKASGELVYRRSQRAKRLSLHAKATVIEVVIPDSVSDHEAEHFVSSQQDWLQRQRLNLRKHPGSDCFPPKQLSLKALEQEWRVVLNKKTPSAYLSLRSSDEPDVNICLGKQMDNSVIRLALIGWLKERATQGFNQAMIRLARAHQFTFRRCHIRHQQTRWGSCNTRGDISLNVRLLFFPVMVAQYVMIHELCHTVHANHSARFWQLVEHCMPNYRQHADTLRQEASWVPGWLHG